MKPPVPKGQPHRCYGSPIVRNGGDITAGVDTAAAEGNSVLGGAGDGTHGAPVDSSKRRQRRRRRKTQRQQLDKTDGTDVAPVRPSGSEDRDTRGSAVTAPMVQPIAKPRVLAPRVSRERSPRRASASTAITRLPASASSRGTLHGLAARPELNGLVVSVQKRDLENGRWVVLLPNGKPVRIHPKT